MVELLWLLLPIAAASGWLVAKQRDMPQSMHPLSPYYFKGLNYLLNEEPDKAIDSFIKIIEIDNETVETHLALGALFRRRGEVNRAIRIHQNLIARPALSPQQRFSAMLELGQDYYRAGLLDRAEYLFQELTHSQEHQIYAYHQLLAIYQQERDWEKAIQTATQLAQVSEHSMATLIAHYYCEQAELFKQQQQYSAALERLDTALKTDPNCVRASLLVGQLAMIHADWQQAIRVFKQIESQDHEYIAEIIEPLQICYQQLDQLAEFTRYLYQLLERYGGIVPTLALTNMIKQQTDEQQAVDFIVKQLHKRPSLHGFDQLLELALSKAATITHEHLLLLKAVTTQLLTHRPRYKCYHCGFKGKSLHWLCPSCHQWNTFKMIQSIETEL